MKYVSRSQIAEKTGMPFRTVKCKLYELGILPHHGEVIDGRNTWLYESDAIDSIREYMKSGKYKPRQQRVDI